MKMIRFLSLFALGGGVLVPLLFEAIGWLLDRYQAANMNLQVYLLRLQLMLWPSSLMTLPAGGDESLYPSLLSLSIVANVVLYVAIGVAIWYGFFKKHHVVLVVLAAVVAFVWWRLLTL